MRLTEDDDDAKLLIYRCHLERSLVEVAVARRRQR